MNIQSSSIYSEFLSFSQRLPTFPRMTWNNSTYLSPCEVRRGARKKNQKHFLPSNSTGACRNISSGCVCSVGNLRCAFSLNTRQPEKLLSRFILWILTDVNSFAQSSGSYSHLCLSDYSTSVPLIPHIKST